MRMSCNGCRVLRKGCSQNCSIRPCLQWIKSPESQANATLFLAKFYGRAGLLNLLNAAPDRLRPEVFKSLLYEASGRIVNPLFGSTGLLSTGNWELCQNAVDAVLKGAPITPVASDASAAAVLPLKACDIGHVHYKEGNRGKSGDLHRVRNRGRFKRAGAKIKENSVLTGSSDEEVNRSTSHESSLCHQSPAANEEPESREIQRLNSVEISQPALDVRHADADDEIELELTLGFAPKVK
nr:LOB domain-containing protein 41-like [Ipomoea batatas]GMD49421.1 LOB domain-containing protein 41-like [Ipomoea batatas]